MDPKKIIYHENWTEPEKWAWDQVCKGEAADFDQKLNSFPDLENRNEWTDERVISPAFLETILLDEMYCVNIPRNGVRISHALIKEQINLSNAQINNELSLTYCLIDKDTSFTLAQSSSPVTLDGCVFYGALNLDYARIEGYLSLIKTIVKGTLNMGAILVNNSLFIREGAEFNEVTLRTAKISGSLDISSVKISGNLDLSSSSIGNSLYINQKSEVRSINLTAAKINGQAEFGGIKIKDTLILDSIVIGSHLFINDNAEINEASFVTASIKGQMELIGASIKGTLNMSSISIGTHLILKEAIELNDVVLVAAEIGGNLDLSGAKINLLNLSSISTGSHIFLNKAAVKEISMITAKIGGQLEMQDTVVEGKLYIASVKIEGNTFLEAQKFSNSVSLILSNLGSSLYISGSEILNIDLGGTVIKGELHIGRSYKEIKWSEYSFMNLRNTEAGAIQDAGENSWPDFLNLGGFTYSRLGGLFGNENYGKEIANRDPGWYSKWLSKDRNYSPQPYHQLAKTFNTMGYPERANSVLYAAKNRERREALHMNRLWQWLGLSLLKWIIGYGYGGRYFRSVIWVICLTFIGVLVLNTTGTKELHSMWDKIGFSLDMLLPIVDLNAKYKLDSFSGWQLYYFYFHKLMGFLLGSFVVAGLSGITKK